ncbi:hypothetical protein KJ830_01815 [bacterium]|nr:hypothetical protein [bacterium]MBU4509763.1 hypothetical protein [bacterium]
MSKTVFILGAGASYSHSNKEFPLINDIFKVAKKLLVTCFLADINTLNPNYECVELYIREKFNKSMFDIRHKLNIEDILTNLEIDIEKTKSNDLQIVRDRVITIILVTFFKLTSKSDYYKKNSEYFLFFNKLNDNDTIITYNWDLLLDNILGREKIISKIKNLGQTEDDISRKQYLRMLKYLSAYRDLSWDRTSEPYDKYQSKGYYLKLHGSIDWLYCPNEDCGSYSKVYPVKKIIGEEYFIADYKCSECSSRMKHLIIPPVLNKNYSSFPFIKKLWNIALEELKSADELVIWGYQLPPTDFYNKWLFRQKSDKLKKVIIINPKCLRNVRKRKNKKPVENNQFLKPFLDIFKASKIVPEISYYENYNDYSNNIKYLDKY